MPFHSTQTQEEADALVRKHAMYKYGEMRIYKTWPDQDIMLAMEHAQKQFDLIPE